MKSAEAVDTRERLASMAGVPEDTIGKVSKVLDMAMDRDLDDLRQGKVSINSVYKKYQYPASSNQGPNELSLVGRMKRLSEKLVTFKDKISPSDLKEIPPIISALSDIVTALENTLKPSETLLKSPI